MDNQMEPCRVFSVRNKKFEKYFHFILNKDKEGIIYKMMYESK